jgi:isovaleryl-CoA dehydrogenase
MVTRRHRSGVRRADQPVRPDSAIAESYVEYKAARCFMRYAADSITALQPADADATKLFAAHVGKVVADRAIQVLGGYGYGQYVAEPLARRQAAREGGGNASAPEEHRQGPRPRA